MPDLHGADERRAEHFAACQGRVEEMRQTPVRRFLIFNGNAQMEVRPARAPIGRDTRSDPFGPLGGGHKNAIRSAADEVPADRSPFARLPDEEIGGEAELHRGAGRTVLVLQLAGGRAPGDDAGVPAIASVRFINDAVLAVVPRVPGNGVPDLCVLHTAAFFCESVIGWILSQISAPFNGAGRERTGVFPQTVDNSVGNRYNISSGKTARRSNTITLYRR